MSNFAVLAAVAALSIPAFASDAASSHWPALARTDLDFVYRTLRDNHPGAIDEQNPYFQQWMETGYAEAKERARQAASLADAKRVLARYAAGFGDGHLGVSFTHTARTQRWSGMFLTRQGSRYLVGHREPSWPAALPPAGAELIACDGKTPDAILDADILPAIFNQRSLEWIRTQLAAKVFWIDELAPHDEYKRCTFATAGGRKEFTLHWSNAHVGDLWNAYDKANPAPPRRSSITRVGPNKYWVHLPEFSPNAQQEAELKELTRAIAGLRKADLVVFDIRGNNGGNSQWGYNILQRLYGDAYMNQLSHEMDAAKYAEWRASKDNLASVEGALATMRQQFAPGSAILVNFTEVAAKMREALATGQPFVRAAGAPPVAPPARPAAPLSRARAVLLTDHGCASSCLDFADHVLLLPGVRHFGQTTAADTVFMDIRTVELPSGLGSLVLAQKVYRGRMRANNEPHIPSVKYGGHMGATPQLKAWVMHQLDQEKRPRASGGARPDTADSGRGRTTGL